jgi:putative aminopeptidase FrvX
MPAGRISIKTYSSEELRLLAAEGRLKGRGIEGLVNLRPDQKARDQEVSIETFALAATRIPCWNTPTDLLRTFVELVQIPSPPGGEEDVADYLEKRLLSFGFEELRRDSFGNLRATLPPTDDTAPNLLITAHMDCVYPGNGTVVRPVFCASGEIRTDGGNSLGADDKAGIASILSTLDYLHNAKLAHGEIRVLFTVQEELGYRGVKQVPASILNSIHLVVSMDPPVRVGRDETAHLAVLHMPPAHPFVHLVREAAQDCGIEPTLLFAEDGYVGGDTICLSPLGAHVVDFCSCSRYPHTAHEHLRIRDLFDQTNWMIATVERMLSYDPSGLELRAVYGEEPIGNLTGVRKQVPLTEDLLKEKVDLARHIHAKPGPKMVPALVHLSAITPRIGDPILLKSVVEAYDRCIRLDQVPQVLRDLTVSLLHFVSNFADVRPLEALIPRAQEVVERGGDESAQVNALRFLEEIFQKERRVVVKARIIRIMILSMQSNSQAVVDRLTEFLRGNLDETIHALTVAFCNRKRGAWERASDSGKSRIVGGRSRGKQEHTGWTIVRQRILQLLLEEDRILPEMMEWIFTHDGVATQRIAVGFIDPNKTSKITTLILQNLKSRERGVQETAVHFVGAHRMVPAVGALIDLLMTPYC